MSRLSDIGREVIEADTGLRHFALTKEERRELVRQAIYLYITDYVESCQASDAPAVCVNKLFEEQGLE